MDFGLWEARKIKVWAGNNLWIWLSHQRLLNILCCWKPPCLCTCCFFHLEGPFPFLCLPVCLSKLSIWSPPYKPPLATSLQHQISYSGRICSPKIQMTSATLTTAGGYCHFASPLRHWTVSPPRAESPVRWAEASSAKGEPDQRAHPSPSPLWPGETYLALPKAPFPTFRWNRM